MAGARTSKLLLLVLVVALLGLAAVTSGLLGSAQAGKTITVGPSGCDFTTIQAAIDAAPNGSIIQVQTGSYKENLTIRNRDGLTLQGAGPDRVTLDGNGPEQKDITPGILVLSSRSITVTGFTITNSRRGLEADDSTLLFIEANTFERNLREGIYLLRSGARIADNAIRGTQRDVDGSRGEGILVSASSGATLLSNVVSDNADCGLRAETDPTQAAPEVTGSGNTITGNRGGDLSGDLPTSLLADPLPEGTQAQVSVPADVPTIQMAVDRVQSGGTILVAAGTYLQSVQSGPVQIYKSLRIVGAGPDKTVLQAPGPEWVAVNIATDGLEVTLEGLMVAGGRRGVQVNTGPTSSVVLRNMTLEGNGTGKPNDFGLRISGDPTATLYQTTIARNDGTGLSAAVGQPKLTIQSSTIVDNSGYGLVLQSAASATMEGSTVSRNGSGGVALFADSRASLVDCTISDNVTSGIQTSDSSQVTVTDTRVTGTKADSDGEYGNGISASRQSKPTIRSCTISGNSLFGVGFYESATGTIEKCTITANFSDGITLFEDSTAAIRGSTVSDNKGYGIYMGGSSRATIEDNTIAGSLYDGISVLESAEATITNNRVTGSAYHGVEVFGQGKSTIRNNTITGNAKHGVRVGRESAQNETATAEISDNTIQNNKSCGVNVDSDSGISIAGRDNKISGNTGGQLCGTRSKFPKGFGGGK